MMRECKRHSQPGDGVCARCLEERLSWLWRGESFRHDNEDDDAMEASTSTCAEGPPSLASVRQQLQVLGVARRPSHHPGQSNEPPQNSKPIIEEWVAFHARRRGEGLEHETSSKSETSSGTEERRAQNPELRILMNAHKMRSQSLPLDFRSAEETAARVISECANEEDAYELEIYEAPPTEPERMVESEPQQRCFSPKWQSPKWVKVLASPMTSRNRVFPSRSKDEHMRKRSNKRGVPRLDSSDWGFSSEATTNGGSSPLWRGSSGMQQRSKSRSVFSWLQDAETTKHEQASEQVTSSSSSDSWLRDLTTVGHLHEIAEELEIVEESSEEEKEEEEELEDLGEVSSFGKFLLQAAQRQPNARLTRLVSARP